MTDFIYKLINPCGVEQQEYIKLHRELFKGAAIDEHWIEWYHKKLHEYDSPDSFTRTYGLYDKERLIGIWSVEPKLMRNSQDNLMKVGRCFAVGVSADYRRMGLFVKLSMYAIDCEKERAEYDYILGFPQTGRSVVGGHIKAGWEEILINDVYSVNLNNNDGLFYRKDVDSIDDFSNISTPINLCNSFDESALYRNIRFLKHPTLQYITFKYDNAHIVLKPYSTFCHILELRGDKENVKRLLEVSKSLCKRHGLIELNVWNNPDALYHNALIKSGFKQGAQNSLPITIIAVRINAKSKLKINKFFNFGMGVEEGY